MNHYQIEYDYDDIVYPVPFNQLYHNKSLRYSGFAKPNPKLPSYVLTGLLPRLSSQDSDILIATGASDNHALGSFNLLYSILLADPIVSILYIDLGLSSDMLTLLSSHFETLHQVQVKLRSNGFLAYRKYNWNSFPEWMNLFLNKEQRGGYSWKAIPMVDAFFEWKGLFSWLDGGCLITDGFSREFTLARRNGFYSPPSHGRIGLWAYPDTRRFMEENGMIGLVDDNDPNCSAGVVFMDYSKSFTQEIMRKYEECAYTQKCVAPRGSTMLNHRQDQSVMSLLLNSYRIPGVMKKNHHPAYRNERPSNQTLYNLVLSIEEVYHIRLNNSVYDYSSLSYKPIHISYSSRPYDY